MNAKAELQIGHSQSKLAIEPRRVRFEYGDISKVDFHSENTVVSAFWVGLSATFPLGEGEFIKAVKLFEDQVEDSKLKDDVKNFTAQEAHHALQHKLVNKQFDSLGFDTGKVEHLIKEKLQEREEQWSNAKRLRRTVAVEHFTAVMAHFALTHPESMKGVPESFRRLFLWHAIEEIEHKSVAFDVYKQCVGDMGKLRRHYAHFAFIEFPMNLILITRFLLKNLNHKSSWAERRGMWRFLFGKGGMISSVKHLYMMFFKKDFHPWQHDDSELVAKWKSELAPYFTHNQA